LELIPRRLLFVPTESGDFCPLGDFLGGTGFHINANDFSLTEDQFHKHCGATRVIDLE